VSFRTRLTLVAAIAVAVAVAAASAVTYVVVRDQLRGEIDAALQDRAATTRRLAIVEDPGTGRRFLDLPPAAFGGAAGVVQLVTSTGETISPVRGGVALPVSDRDRAAAESGGDAFFSDATVSGVHLRLMTVPLGDGYALQIARPLDEVDRTLSRIRTWLAAVMLGGVGIAVALGLVVAGAALAPVRRLSRAAEHVTETHDLSERIDASGTDELSRLAGMFNSMLEALEQSAKAQRQLVSDASHELRTPLTSIRTNIEVLARDTGMPTQEREQVLGDVTAQLEEMTVLVAELVELARGDHRETSEPEEVRLDLLLESAVERARRHWPEIRWDLRADETTVDGVPASLERALANLLDNAAKWSVPGGAVEVELSGGEVTVRDHGSGIAAEDRPFVFDRFYRAPSARGLPGSGLGLAIVKQVAEAHGGAVAVEAPADGGTRMRLTLPGARAMPAPAHAPA
jgi:two-component system sensor histidine kinase MprB